MTSPRPAGARTDPDARLLRRATLQIAAWTSTAVAALILVMAAAVLIVDEHQQHQQADRVSQDAWADADDVSDPPARTWLVVRAPSGRRQVTPGAPAGVAGIDPADLRDGIVRTVRQGRELVIYTGDRPVGRVSAVYDLSPRELEERRLQISLGIAALIGILGAGAVGALIGRRAVRPLGQALALQRRFVADASHELRTPLSVLLLRAQLLQRHLRHSLDTERAQSLDQLVHDAKIMGDVVNDLLLSAELHHRPRTGQRVDLTSLATDVARSMQPLAAEQDVELTVRGPDPGSAPAVINGTAVALRRAVAALVDNAVAHTPPEGRVQLRVMTAATTVAVTVTDDGEGLDATDTRRLVERFSRGTARGDGRRFGLGLSLVDEVARAHAGTLTVDSAPGAGAAFTLTFPADPGTGHGDAPGPATGGPSTHRL
jgi:two-component system, OmpR family, sensor kinase